MSWFDAQEPAFIAVEPFGPWRETWADYVAWSGLTQLREVVSLDAMLCPTVLPEIKDAYWPHIVNEDFALQYFTDLEFLSRETAETSKKNILCVFRNPPSTPIFASPLLDFEFLGYDLIEKGGSISALTNCGGFPDVFSKDELSQHGLIASHSRASQVHRELPEAHPNEVHANCDMWAIFRARP